jgi:hypothetical protein
MDPRISRIKRMGENRAFFENLLRTLGCECPPEVFTRIQFRDLSEHGLELACEIGGRLLVAFVPPMDSDELLTLLERGRKVRDKEKLNRFRLIVVGSKNRSPGEIDALSLILRRMDNRLHVHFLEENQIEDLTKRVEPRP